MDETMVGDYPLVDYMAREAELVNIKYPMAGMTSHQVKLGVYNPGYQTNHFSENRRTARSLPDQHLLEPRREKHFYSGTEPGAKPHASSTSTMQLPANSPKRVLEETDIANTLNRFTLFSVLEN